MIDALSRYELYAVVAVALCCCYEIFGYLLERRRRRAGANVLAFEIGARQKKKWND